MMRAVWFFVLILLVVTPQRVCTCQHEHQAHIPAEPADTVEDSSCQTVDSDHHGDCQCKTRIGDAPKRVAIELDELVAFLPADTASDNCLSRVETTTFVKQAYIPAAVPLYLSTARLRP